MYVTRPLSLYSSSPEAINALPPEGPNSGFLVINQERYGGIKALPLSQSKIIAARYSDIGDTTGISYVLFIPVLNQPLSANRYYMISAEGNHQGLAYQSSTEEDRETYCWCGSYVAERRPRRLNPLDIYQQFKLTLDEQNWAALKGTSVARDGIVTGFFEQGCNIYASRLPKHKSLELTEEASGLNSILRNSLPSFDFTLARERTPPVIVGKWICPFMLIWEGRPKDQMKNSSFYVMTLEQRWERVFACENVNGTSLVEMNVVVPTEVVMVNGKEAVLERDEEGGVLLLSSLDDQMQVTKLGLSLVIVERMIWEQERVGWVEGNEKRVMVKKVEVFSEGGNECCSWRKYGCYVLVERFVLKRMDGSLVLTYEFKHTQQMKCKWE